MTKREQSDWRQFVMQGASSLLPAPAAIVTAPTPIPGVLHSSPSYDPLDGLPPAAADRLRLLRQRRDDKHAVIPPFEAIREASMARVDAANTLKRLRDPAGDGGFNLPATHPAVLEAERTLGKATDEFERLQTLQTERSTSFQVAGAAVANVESWLRHAMLGGVTLEDAVEIEPPKLAKNESLMDGILRLQRRGRELKADLHRVQSAPYPSKYIKARLREAVEILADRGTPDVSAMIEVDGDLVWPTVQVRSTVYNTPGATAFHEAIDVVGLFAAILKPAVISFLDGLVDEEKDDPAALSHEARQKAEAEVMGDLIAVEREESFFVYSAQAQGLPVEHRADCAPVAILNLVLITVARGTALPPTSVEHSSPLRR